MYFDVNGKQVFATTGGKPFDNSKPVVLFLQRQCSGSYFLGPAVAILRVQTILSARSGHARPYKLRRP